MPRAFVLLGWLFLAVTLVLAVLFFVGYYTLTAVELVAGHPGLRLDHPVHPQRRRAAARLRAVARSAGAPSLASASAADSLAA